MAGITLLVYRTDAILSPPQDPYEDNCDVMLSVGQLRELAKMATWAADRLDARPSVAEIVAPYKRADLG